MDISSVVQEQVVLDEGGHFKFWHHFGDPALQKAPESAACQVLQRAGCHCQTKDRLVELFVVLVGI